MSKAIIYIEETNSMADVTFPSVPQVFSLLQYDDTSRARHTPPVAGYPVVCVTVRIMVYQGLLTSQSRGSFQMAPYSQFSALHLARVP